MARKARPRSCATAACCLSPDVRPMAGSPNEGRAAQWLFCRRCGARHHLVPFVAARGGTDWRYVQAEPPWPRAPGRRLAVGPQLDKLGLDP